MCVCGGGAVGNTVSYFSCIILCLYMLSCISHETHIYGLCVRLLHLPDFWLVRPLFICRRDTTITVSCLCHTSILYVCCRGKVYIEREPTHVGGIRYEHPECKNLLEVLIFAYVIRKNEDLYQTFAVRVCATDFYNMDG